jgi:sporulation protein YlmC with PRC-barrel domain
MLQLSSAFLNKPVMSLRTGGQIATAMEPIINPNNLKIVGFKCQDKFSKDSLILLSQDIRDVLPQGFAVNDHEVLSQPGELVRLKEVLEMDFQLLGKPVVTVNKKRLGKVNDYAAETETMFVQKLYVSQSILKSLSTGQISVERTRIVEITNRKIVIQDPLEPLKNRAPAAAVAPS